MHIHDDPLWSLKSGD